MQHAGIYRVSIFKMYVTVIFESFFTLFFWWVYLAETFLNATFCNIPYPVTYLLSNAWPWKTTEEINVVFICPSVGIFKCNEPLLQINYTRHMDHRSLLCMSPNQIFLAISKLVLSVYLSLIFDIITWYASAAPLQGKSQDTDKHFAMIITADLCAKTFRGEYGLPQRHYYHSKSLYAWSCLLLSPFWEYTKTVPVSWPVSPLVLLVMLAC